MKALCVFLAMTGAAFAADMNVVNGGRLINGSQVIVNGNANFASGSTFQPKIASAVPVTGYGQLQVKGTVTLGGATLSTTLGFTPAAGNAFKILDKTLPGAISGIFNGLPEGKVFTVGGTTFQITYLGGDGNDVVLIALTALETPSLTVTTTSDTVDNLDRQTSLREAIAYANTLSGPQTITFDAILFATPQTITLTLGELAITNSLTILGTGSGNLAVMRSLAGGTPAFRIFTNSSIASIFGLTISNGLVMANGLGEIFGGGLANFGTLTLSNCIVSGNAVMTSIIASPTYEALGGALYNGPGQTATVVDCTFRGNSVIAQGAAANNYEAKGGGVFNDGGTVRLLSSTFNDNLALAINGTTALALGGAVGNDGGTIAMTNCTVSGNTAIATNAPVSNVAQGGGIGAGGGSIVLNLVTVASNTVTAATTAAGGGVYNSPASTASVQDMLIAGNHGTTGSDAYGAFLSGGHNLVGVATPATGWVSSDLAGTIGSPLDARLGPLASNGGPTRTHALLPGSPAIDAGDNAAAAGLTTDQRGAGYPRSFNTTVDIGAFEYQGPTITLQPQDLTACAGSTASFTATAIGTPSPTFQWQVSSDSGANFSDVSGETSSPLSFAATLAQSGYRYRAVFTGGSLSVTSSVAKLTVNPLPVGGPDAFTTPTNTPVTLSAAKLKANDTGSGLTIIAVSSPSTQGGTVSLSSPDGVVSYTPPSATFGGTDTFIYTLRNDSGCTVSVTVTATVGYGTGQGVNVVYGPIIDTATSPQQFVVRFAGHPGYAYTIEFSVNPTGPWTKKVNVTAPLDNAAGFGIGVFEFREDVGTGGFYRTVYPSY